jgi:hypothetical protein
MSSVNSREGYKQYLPMVVSNMGTNPYKEKMPNRGMGREMGSREEDDDKPQDVNVQEIDTDPQIPGPSPTGLGTNFTQERKSRTDRESE